MCMSIIKPASANWIVFAYDSICFVPAVVMVSVKLLLWMP